MTLYVLLGPTAVGKTEFALQMAEKLGSPILNCDSRQMYRGMEIGTASPTEEQQRRVKHYFVGTLDIGTYYSAAQYEQDVLALISELSSTHQSLLLSGGSMMYLDAVCNGIDDIPTVDAEVRETLRQRLLSGEIDEMRSELHLLDPNYYLSADTRNPKRVVHALEVCYTTGRPYSSFLTRERKPRPFSIVKIGLRRERQDLFDRINRRVDTMMEEGLLDEARRLYPLRHENALNTVGYKELFRYLDGEWTLPFAIEKIKKNTRDYAKKQMTWFAHDTSIQWIELRVES
ncbi:MAG: tRNA (adenosine(37)-N6)-dimethylallyltransferase MiaA [Bacteroidaceae bacterium]|nr:tRNA (adenosine(37)-N6)-dimethylallyltransferase MiaA [Bacteroidaceae bacterium]MBR4516540.1 tRNA (adenosine(37)-N6)-dimethylallyltransferase MiaA [Bacteroidaceae bacterium]